jgi:gliding motility-associated lipoprotein GldH
MYRKLLTTRIIGILALMLTFASCDMERMAVYQKYVSIPNYAWTYHFKPSFEFDITDTAAQYNMYFTIRHTNAYPYSNIWLQIRTVYPNDSLGTGEIVRLEIPLAESDGKWLGRGMGEIFEQRMPLTRDDKPLTFPVAGRYKIELAHDMRSNPLTDVLDVGIRVEKK